MASVMNYVQFYYFTPVCFIEGSAKDNENFAVHYAFFYIPMSVSNPHDKALDFVLPLLDINYYCIGIFGCLNCESGTGMFIIFILFF